MIHHDGTTLFPGLDDPFEATRYHSLIVDRDTVDNNELRITAWTADKLVMAIEHRRNPHFGVQFHPESYLSLCGMDILARFLKRAGVALKPDWESSLAEACRSRASEGVPLMESVNLKSMLMRLCWR